MEAKGAYESVGVPLLKSSGKSCPSVNFWEADVTDLDAHDWTCGDVVFAKCGVDIGHFVALFTPGGWSD